MVGKIIRVSYREYGTDYAQICVLGKTNSAHEIAEHDNTEDAAMAGPKLNLRDYRRGYGDWDQTIIWRGPAHAEAKRQIAEVQER